MRQNAQTHRITNNFATRTILLLKWYIFGAFSVAREAVVARTYPHTPCQIPLRRLFRSPRLAKLRAIMVNALSPVQTERVSARRRASTRPIKLTLKIGSIHTDRVDARCVSMRVD